MSVARGVKRRTVLALLAAGGAAVAGLAGMVPGLLRRRRVTDGHSLLAGGHVPLRLRRLRAEELEGGHDLAG